jgi:transposase
MRPCCGQVKGLGCSGSWRAAQRDRRGIKRLVEQLGTLAPELGVIEATGGMQRAVVAALWAAEIKVAMINPAWIPHAATFSYTTTLLRPLRL